VHEKGRTLIAMAGVSFAIVLIFLQLGFRGTAEATATVLYDRIGDFEVVLVSSDYRDMNRSQTFPLARIYQARKVPGVANAHPLYLTFSFWRNPTSGIVRNMFVVGYDPNSKIFRGLPELDDSSVIAALKRPDTVLVDRKSHPDFGLVDGHMPAGVHHTELGGQRVDVVGYFSLGTGFASDGSVITSDETFAGLPHVPGVSLGLVRLERGADPDAVCRVLRETLPSDVLALTRKQLENQERSYWLNGKSIGVLFTTGVVVAFLVGTIFVYQIISTDITNHLPEYATLKAMGYAPRYLSKVVLEQAVILGVLSYFPAFLVALGLYAVTRKYARVPCDMNLTRAVAVFALSIAMCSLSGMFALRKVHSADPADLF
jgi:putative ABC transport system permease protein